jgi:hypothetical protein
MTAEEAIGRAVERHTELGCCCGGLVVRVLRRGEDDYSVTLGHYVWCPFTRSFEGPTP